MTRKEIDKKITLIVQLIHRGALKEAFDAIGGFIVATNLLHYERRCDELQATYRSMLNYHVDGIKDPMEEQIYASICRSMVELIDQIKEEVLSIDDPSYYYAVRRTIAASSTRIPLLVQQLSSESLKEDQRALESTVSQLFDQVWTSRRLEESEVLLLRGILKDPSSPQMVKCQIVSALLLALQFFFDKEKIDLLFDAAELPDNEVRLRAYVAFSLALYTHRARTSFYPKIQYRLDTLSETADFDVIMRSVIFRFILTRETEKITHKLQEEIIPEMMKLTQKINPDLKLNDLFSELANDEINPEWNDLMSNSQLSKRLEEYNALQEEGADVMHSTFIHLKNFSFFGETSHWFLPFSQENSEVKEHQTLSSSIVEGLAKTSMMCNSDKYSFYFSLLQIPQQQREMLTAQLEGQIHEMLQQQSAEMQTAPRIMDGIIRQYIQDLYRFYKLHPQRESFEDLFTQPLAFHLLPALTPYLTNTETMLYTAETYLRKKYFQEALTIFQELLKEENGDGMIYQKIGYCKQMMGDLEGALEAYLRAEILSPDSKWLIRRIAGCYRGLKQPEKALMFYLQLEQLIPDNVSILNSIGHCYVELQNVQEALNYFFKANYLDAESLKVWRAIAWCSFLIGKYDQAMSYYQRILEKGPQMQDYLNAGHTRWALQQVREALDYYKKAVLDAEGGLQLFYQLFKDDKPFLLSAGIEPSEIALVLDQLRYLIQEEEHH